MADETPATPHLLQSLFAGMLMVSIVISLVFVVLVGAGVVSHSAGAVVAVGDVGLFVAGAVGIVLSAVFDV